jgi:putative ABC transport system permease protein
VTELLTRLIGRLPIGWLQLIHNRLRLAAALAGVAFANILVMMQLGFLGALISSIRLPYEQFDADLMVSAPDMNTLQDSSPLPRQRMFEILTVQGVKSASPLYLGKFDWRQADNTFRTLAVIGVDPMARTFKTPEIEAARDELKISDIALIDRKTRNIDRRVFAAIGENSPVVFEARGRTLDVIGSFSIGAGFTDDGYLIVSDQTFLKLYPQRVSGAPNHILVKLEPNANPAMVMSSLRSALPAYDSTVQTIDAAVARDQKFQSTQKPVGLVFGFGAAIGVLVGIIIVYQVLSTDVADHIREYATFKAMGYAPGFFLGIIVEEALILAILGFIPGILVSLVLYKIVALATDLPMEMTLSRALAVMFGTILACIFSGAIATRRVAKANPADLF